MTHRCLALLLILAVSGCRPMSRDAVLDCSDGRGLRTIFKISANGVVENIEGLTRRVGHADIETTVYRIALPFKDADERYEINRYTGAALRQLTDKTGHPLEGPGVYLALTCTAFLGDPL